ncbi:hypothetical protein IMZ31_20145 (plasmid) [Pontibacillus sp. ALD_SL1]|uniref:hypothetical protein n=1 Tax=Pontibacillus sp. ALD_SL1 TaxID=2777185 RepID=UPI001A96028D|nr:hypothetical protein [Pontibacillus sp. ALD_SL1]QST02863.1 hypothetical protein IMZ31_20145 [Pontibacillus sp. ALD_SL1]
MMEALVHKLHPNRFTYLLNSMGEETGHAPIPSNVHDWYDNLVMDTGLLQYLVRFGETYGMLVLDEVDHVDTDTWKETKDGYSKEWQAMDEVEVGDHLEKVSSDLSERVTAPVYLGLYTGIYGKHEVALFFPQGTEKDIYKKDVQQFEKTELTL